MIKISRCICFLVCLFLFASAKVHGQLVSISLGALSNNQINPNSLWQGVISSNQTSIYVELSLVVTNNSKGVIYSAYTDKLELKNATTVIEYNNIKILRTDFPNQEIKAFIEKTGGFPSGLYTCCISVINAQTKEVLSNDCQNVNALLYSSLLLNSPENKSSINNLSPLFVWSPLLMPVTDRMVQYEIKVCEMLKNQTATDAIIRNRPLMQKSRIANNQLIYTNDMFPLSYGKTYAWQVTATDNMNNVLGRSEIWEYTPMLDTIQTKVVNYFQSYIDLNASATQSEYYIKNTIKVKYTDRKYPSELSYTIYDEKGNLIEKSSTHLKVLSRENWYELNIDEHVKLKHKNKYSIEFTNSSQQSFTINFIYFQ